jgi:hypothetical protein
LAVAGTFWQFSTFGQVYFSPNTAWPQILVPHVDFMQDWFEERLEGQNLVDDVVTKYVPPHIGLFYCLDGMLTSVSIPERGQGSAFTWLPSVIETGGNTLGLSMLVLVGGHFKSHLPFLSPDSQV